MRCATTATAASGVPGHSLCQTTCGDGIRAEYEGHPPADAEQCDDGNTEALDGCGPTCTVEPGWSCWETLARRSECYTYCGDGVIAKGAEICDDGNHALIDACPSGDGGSCVPAYCGDGFIWSDGGSETCDDGNSESGDGCSAICTIEPNWQCDGMPSICACMPGFADANSDGVCEPI